MDSMTSALQVKVFEIMMVVSTTAKAIQCETIRGWYRPYC